MSEKQVNKIDLPRMDKILLTMYKLGGLSRSKIKFEDLVVAVFKDYPDHFHLRGYKQYPDSEALNNALYHNLKKRGVINYGNKTFSLTNKGEDYVLKLKQLLDGKRILMVNRFDRYIEREIKRLIHLRSFEKFLCNDYEKILDVDFYEFLGVTVKTEKNDFVSLLKIINYVIKILKNTSNKEYNQLLKYCNFMMKKFTNEINYKVNL